MQDKKSNSVPLRSSNLEMVLTRGDPGPDSTTGGEDCRDCDIGVAGTVLELLLLLIVFVAIDIAAEVPVAVVTGMPSIPGFFCT